MINILERLDMVDRDRRNIMQWMAIYHQHESPYNEELLFVVPHNFDKSVGHRSLLI